MYIRLMLQVFIFGVSVHLLACGDTEPTNLDLETEELLIDETKADQHEVRIRTDGMSIWLRPTLEPMWMPEINNELWRFRARTSHNIGSVSASVNGVSVEHTLNPSPRVFEVFVDFRKISDVIAGEPILVRIENERGQIWHLRLDIRPRLRAGEGSWRIYPWLNVVPVVNNNRVWMRGRVTTNVPMTELYAVNDDDSEPEFITRQDDRRWKLDWHPRALPWAAFPTEEPIWITAVDNQGQRHTLPVEILFQVRGAGITSGEPEAVWPVPACTPAVRACLFELQSSDTEACGEAPVVLPCVEELDPEGQNVRITESATPFIDLESGDKAYISLFFDKPAPEGTTLQVSATGSMLPMDPIPVRKGARTLHVEVQASDSPGPGFITFFAGGLPHRVEFNAFDESCLVISQYVDGDGANNKAIQLYNCSDHMLDLSKFYVCIASNDAATCGNTVRLEADPLAPGGIFNLCRTTAISGTNPYPDISNNCSQIAPGVMTFNGDDRLLVFRDRDGDGRFSPGDDIKDAFGELAVRPTSLIWGKRTYIRCNFTPFDGMSPFEVQEYFKEYPVNTVEMFGWPPEYSEKCN